MTEEGLGIGDGEQCRQRHSPIDGKQQQQQHTRETWGEKGEKKQKHYLNYPLFKKLTFQAIVPVNH